MSYDFMSYNLGDAFMEMSSFSFIEVKKQIEQFIKNHSGIDFELDIISYTDYEDIDPLQSQEFYKQGYLFLPPKIFNFFPLPQVLDEVLIKNINPKYENQINVKYCYEVIATLENGNKEHWYNAVIFPQDKKIICLSRK